MAFNQAIHTHLSFIGYNGTTLRQHSEHTRLQIVQFPLIPGSDVYNNTSVVYMYETIECLYLRGSFEVFVILYLVEEVVPTQVGLKNNCPYHSRQ